MAVFEEVIARAKSMAEVAGKKTGELVETTKIKLEIAELQRDIAALYEGLGRLVYDGRQSGESVEDMIESCVAHLEEQNAYLQDLQDRLLENRNAVRCTACGTVNDDTARFCSQCGKNL